jgi:hypothetical protein
LVQFDEADSAYWRAVQGASFFMYFSQATHGQTALWAPTANVSFWAADLRAVGGFDETLPFRLGGDDVDLGLRITRLGRPLRYNPRAVAHHTAETWTKAALVERAFRWGATHYHLVRRHPARRTVALPNVPLAWGLLFVGGGAGWLVSRQPGYLWLAWVWLALCLPLEALLTGLVRGRARGAGRDWLAAQMGLLFNAGALWEGLRHLDPRILFFSLAYSDPQPGDAPDFQLLQRKHARVWAMVLALVGTALIAPWVAA